MTTDEIQAMIRDAENLCTRQYPDGSWSVEAYYAPDVTGHVRTLAAEVQRLGEVIRQRRMNMNDPITRKLAVELGFKKIDANRYQLNCNSFGITSLRILFGTRTGPVLWYRTLFDRERYHIVDEEVSAARLRHLVAALKKEGK